MNLNCTFSLNYCLFLYSIRKHSEEQKAYDVITIADCLSEVVWILNQPESNDM